MAHGGKRKNSGRPKGSLATHTLEAQTLRQYIIAEILANKKELVEALIGKAKSGDVSAIKELFDRSLGKVKDSMEISTPAESPLAGILRDIRSRNKGIIAERTVEQMEPETYEEIDLEYERKLQEAIG